MRRCRLRWSAVWISSNYIDLSKMSENLRKYSWGKLGLLLLSLALAADSDSRERLIFDVTGWNSEAGFDPVRQQARSIHKCLPRHDDLFEKPPETSRCGVRQACSLSWNTTYHSSWFSIYFCIYLRNPKKPLSESLQPFVQAAQMPQAHIGHTFESLQEHVQSSRKHTCALGGLRSFAWVSMLDVPGQRWFMH